MLLYWVKNDNVNLQTALHIQHVYSRWSWISDNAFLHAFLTDFGESYPSIVYGFFVYVHDVKNSVFIWYGVKQTNNTITLPNILVISACSHMNNLVF